MLTTKPAHFEIICTQCTNQKSNKTISIKYDYDVNLIKYQQRACFKIKQIE